MTTDINMIELELLCKPIVDYLNKHCSPHDTIIVTQDSIKLLEAVCGIPLKN